MGNIADCRVTVDIVVLKEEEENISGKTLSLLLIKRGHDPFAGSYALPGGFLDDTDETLEEAAARELLEETGVKVAPSRLSNFGTYGDKGRDPRGRTVTGAFLIVLNDHESKHLSIQAGDDAREAAFFKITQLPDLAFDHKKVIKDGLNYLKLSAGLAT